MVEETKSTQEKPQEGYIRLVILSDTHNQENRMPDAVPDGDVLIHCGDLTNVGKARELQIVNEWFGKLPHKTKIAIAGNHDVGLDIKQYDELWKRFHASNQEDPVENRKIMTNVTMLYDEAITLDCGLKVYGSPYSPEFCNWAFSLKTK